MADYRWTKLGKCPLISCIMPTYGRPRLVPESIEMFLEQDYPNKELIIFNDCPGQVYRANLPGVRIFNIDHRFQSLGEKRNSAIEQANGDVIAVWDDDDIYLPWRLSFTWSQMEERRNALYIPAEFWAYWGERELLTNSAVPGWICHPGIMFRKDLWALVGGYPEITLGEDSGFIARALRSLDREFDGQKLSYLDRFFILRGKSPYRHTSIEGGLADAEIAIGAIQLTPKGIEDRALFHATRRLAYRRRAFERKFERRENATSFTERDELMYLDEIAPVDSAVGYGQLGLSGDLGYEGARVTVGGIEYHNSISAHGSSIVEFQIDGQFDHFESQVAINDDSIGADTSADFLVIADGLVVGVATNVIPGDPRRFLTADIRGARELKLVVAAHRWDHCHSVWLNPRLSRRGEKPPVVGTDCLGRATIVPPGEPIEAGICIATVGSPGFEGWIDDLFASIRANSCLEQVKFVIFFLGESGTLDAIARKYHATVIRCNALAPIGPATKSILYSVGRYVDAEKYLCIDADTLVLGDLRPMMAAIESSPPGSIHVCRDSAWFRDLSEAMERLYCGSASDISMLLNGIDQKESEYGLIVNDGVFAADRPALNALDELIRHLPNAPGWVDQNPECGWRNQFIFNLALAKAKCGRELNPAFNVQVQSWNARFSDTSGVIHAEWNGQRASIVHFCGGGRGRYPEWRNRFARVPLSIGADAFQRDYFGTFRDALQQWVGNSGQKQLAWSFYGTSDGQDAVIRDFERFGLYSTLHWLVRSNGCSRVIETGTARGVSAACLAAAVAHRTEPLVVSIDCAVMSERDVLWDLLPLEVRACIETRQQDSLVALAECASRGETFHAALLDTIHECDYVLKEFELARQIVCPGGLIFVHDPLYRYGTVADAICAIDRMGYRVITLWSAEGGEKEDDGLGLAVIENRKYARQ